MPSGGVANGSHRTAAITVLTLVVVLFVAVEYSVLRARYDWVYSWYASVTARLPPGTPVGIGPTRIVLAFERPWVSAAFLARPLPQTAAEFLLRAIRSHVNPEFLLFGPGPALYGANALPTLKGLVASEASWQVPGNPLYANNGNIPFYSEVVQGYRAQVYQTPGAKGDLSLQILWLYGYEEYVRQRFTGAATSVLGEWNFMFAVDTPAPLPEGSACNGLSIAGGFMSAGVAAAGVGAMMGAPEGGIGAVPGAVIGFLVGGVGSLLGKTQCL